MIGDTKLSLGVLLATATMAAPALAQTPAEDVTAAMQGQLAAEVLEGCNAELVQYCAGVTPGEGRLLACLFAYDDKLSGQCEFALYNAAVRLAGTQHECLRDERVRRRDRKPLRAGGCRPGQDC